MPESDYLTERQARERVWHYAKKYNHEAEMRDCVVDWFDGQIDVGVFLGVPYSDLYLKNLDIDGLFRKAASTH